MRYRLLGPLEVIGDAGQVLDLAGDRERVLLATLVLGANHAVSTIGLVDAVWGEDPPATATNALQVHVSKLRKKLAEIGAGDVIARAPQGYVLQTAPGDVDLEEFEHLVGAAAGDPAEVSTRLSEALALWRGPALVDVSSDLLAGEKTRLEELRLLTLERRIEADLAMGHHAELIGELEALVHAQPLREGPRRQLMLALYRSGRQADALATYRAARKLLAEELGIDPGPELQALEVAILRQDTALEAPSVSEVVKPPRADLPTGTVTLLMSDLEGSTRLWEEHPEEMADALRRHDELLRTAIEANRGYVVKTMGDAFHAAFRTAQDAAAAAIETQQRVASEPWPATTELRVRIALHTGHCEERDGDYYGPAVNRVARLTAIGYGGQVLVSGTTAEILEDGPERTVALHDLGLHHLKDLSRPERVFQLNVEGLETVFPPLRSLDSPIIGHNLPVQNTSFVGRETEIAEVISLLDRSHLVTLTGSGGSGKSRLALEVAAETLDAFGNSVWLAELAPVADPELVVATVAAALGVREEPGRPLEDTVMAAISDRRLLVVLDNCEHVLDACSDLTDRLVRSCPNLGVLATSREPLGIDGEQLYRVPSLSLPEAKEPSDPEVAIAFDAVHLFVDRAKAHVSSFVLDQTQVSAVVSLCRRLDGMPLAIELAAAWVSSLSVADIEMRLDDRFRLLTKGRRTALPRQQTLRALIDWSYDALTPKEQDLLRRLSVFAGGWDLDTCQSVCSSSGPAEPDVVGVLSSLVSKSLVQTEQADEGMRYGLLETVREYAREKLFIAGPDVYDSTRNAHAHHFLDMVEVAAAQFRGPDQLRWLERLDDEYENVRSALSHMARQENAEAVLRISVALKEYWIRRGFFNEGRQVLTRALEMKANEDWRLRASAMIVAGRLGNELQHSEWCHALLVEALELSQQMNDAALTSAALAQLSYTARDGGDYRRAMELANEAVDAASHTGDPILLGEAHLLKSVIPSPEGRGIARQEVLKALSLFSEAGDSSGLEGAHLSSALNELRDGNLESSRAQLEIVLHEVSKEDRRFLELHTYFGIISLLEGNASSAAESFKEGLALAARMGQRLHVCLNVIGLAGCASTSADHERAAILYGAASALAEHAHLVVDPDVNRVCEWDIAGLRRRMGEAAFAAQFEKGTRLAKNEIIDLALE